MVIFSCNQISEEELKIQKEKRQQAITDSLEILSKKLESEIIQIELKSLIEEIDSRDEKVRFMADRKYSGKRLQITGRTNGMSSEGYLRLQVKPFQNPIKCYGLSDEFMVSINEDDMVQITGDFELKNISDILLRHGVLYNCKGIKVDN